MVLSTYVMEYVVYGAYAAFQMEVDGTAVCRLEGGCE